MRRDEKVAKKRRRRKKLATKQATQDPVALARNVLTTHREAARVRLTEETEALIAAGARPEEILWLLSPTSQDACLAQSSIAAFRAEAPDLAEQLAIWQSCLPSGHLSCAYVGPEGVLLEAIRVDVSILDKHHRCSA